MKVKDVIWFTQIPIGTSQSCIGIVYGTDDHTGERKAYMASVTGNNEHTDTLDVIQFGAKVLPYQAEMLNDFLNPKT